ncbi:MAG TPA: multicopper oxidase domain-containing protein [Gemmatimonadaceae bacterium]|nr:multicopper oxidase domain-containing protein [Gemmatimonadaceae bacterium]
MEIEKDTIPASDERQAPAISRRQAVKWGALGSVGLAAVGAACVPGTNKSAATDTLKGGLASGHGSHHDMIAVGELRRGSFDPTAFLTHFDYGRVSKLPSGQTLREYDMEASEFELEVAPGVFFPAWGYNGQVPGPTIRCTEGDRLRVHFKNSGTHPHTIHFHGFHPANMDGSFEVVGPGHSFVYEFDAEPFGLHLYHCHTVPLKRHIHKGLYGAFIIDPREGRPPAREMVMVLNAFDTNFDGENEVYAVNSVAFHYQKYPIPLRVGEAVRVYTVNITEFDPINSFHLHANFYKLYRTGTSLTHHEFTDNVMLCQGERAILEFTYNHEGPFLFHAHQSEFAELGWTGMFTVSGEQRG